MRRDGRLSWVQQRRQEFIAGRLLFPGFLVRSNLAAEFDISLPQASADIKMFMDRNPGAMHYNASAKQYEPGAGLPPWSGQKSTQDIVDDCFRGAAALGAPAEMVHELLKGTPSEGMGPSPKVAEECARLRAQRATR